MSSEETSNSSNSSSNSSNSGNVSNLLTQLSNDSDDQRFERRRQANRVVDRIMDQVMMSNPVKIYQAFNQILRAPRKPVERHREDGQARLWNDYFVDPPVFPAHLFRRRFRMRQHVFLRIKNTLEERHLFFQQRQDATDRFGASALQKCTVAMRLIAYGTSADYVEDYIRISGSLARDCLQHFVKGVVSYFSDEYLKKPNEENLVRQLRIGGRRGFPRMLGSIDCMHWRWKNCPLSLKGMFSGKAGRAPPINYVVYNHQYSMGYYLTDVTYPRWAAFIPSISLPQNEKEGRFAKKQESMRKDVERAFGVLQARFAIIRNPALARDESMLGKIMIACIIMYNMIVEDERDTYATYYDPTEYDQASPPFSSRRNNEPFQFQNSENRIASLDNYMYNRARVRDEDMHRALKSDLVEHLWLKFGGKIGIIIDSNVLLQF